MNRTKQAIAAGAVILVVAFGPLVRAGDAADRLKVSMVAERMALVEEVVKGWREQRREADLRKTITRLMDVHVRLQALDDKAGGDLVGRLLTKVDATKIRTVRELASALVQSYYREKDGLAVNSRTCFSPVYYIWPARVEEEK